ncbi:MAG TPA: arsenic resistance N-acetyltransferase ArsN2 [Gemmatimonadales bacterium]|nr:arsenic resistance N-acetyltransferase ArsN2 [Gemmatimonadales bacterium]
MKPLLRPARPEDRAAEEALLTEVGLPLAGLDECFANTWVAEAGDDPSGSTRLVGMAGVEIYPDGALLRSVAVHPHWRGRGLGCALVMRALEAAGEAGVLDVYLLTTNAADWFPRLGFAPIAREAVPVGVRQSIEFREVCPVSATVMHQVL